MTEFNAPTFIVVRSTLQQAAEAAAAAADPDGGAGTFVPGIALRAAGDATNTVVGYWARWNMKNDQRNAFASNIGGPLNLLDVTKTPNLSRDKWFFDASEGQWAPEAVLAALGWDTLDFGGP